MYSWYNVVSCALLILIDLELFIMLHVHCTCSVCSEYMAWLRCLLCADETPGTIWNQSLSQWQLLLKLTLNNTAYWFSQQPSISLYHSETTHQLVMVGGRERGGPSQTMSVCLCITLCPSTTLSTSPVRQRSLQFTLFDLSTGNKERGLASVLWPLQQKREVFTRKEILLVSAGIVSTGKKAQLCYM